MKPRFEFHIKRSARTKYRFDQTFFAIKGDVIFADFNAVRQFAYLINRERDLQNYPEQRIQASELNAMGLLDEIMHFIIEKYREEINPDLLNNIDQMIHKKFGPVKSDSLYENFAEDFPTTDVYSRKETSREYLNRSTGNLANRHVVIEELIVLWLDNANPAYQPIGELIDDNSLAEKTIYKDIFKELDLFLKISHRLARRTFHSWNFFCCRQKNIHIRFLPQLEYIKSQWGQILGSILSKILMGMDFIREEEKMRFDIGVFGPGPTEIIEFDRYDFEPEQFSPDLDWMPKVVLMAKSTFVWLDQMSKQYQRSITTLDQIPDEELDRLAYYGFTGLWLIGLWERSKASRTIKQWRGNPEAVASAYSLMRYEIAEELGGDVAYQNLRDRAWKRGIRLASDMVPNHMGIDSDWVMEHPDWFIQTKHSPFPSYIFSSENLCDNPNIVIQIENGYWNNSDAAVVFKRIDTSIGDECYIYHGNDGTSMPWNDTAQLNFLMPEVREAVIQTILHVARKFQIIRFDAAMTLAKKHYARLWFPQPGSGGDIPSRAEHALTKEQFDHLFPVEFWREVVDRIQQEVPDTLLLAEAFWMMEGYFVRSLGMHRVYNSAFMNMLKNEENDKYRQSIKNVLEFNPQILKRYVNFMNNPDEETAVDQFGSDDKYFGVCILMTTMPGLPMFGHGQIEGYHEKYGMEYKRAYWNESIDQKLVRRHEYEIIPLLRKRYLFSDVVNFLLYDMYSGDGQVQINVFAYSNRFGSESSLVVYNNKFEETGGWIKTSAQFLEGDSLRNNSLAEGLALDYRHELYTIFRDQISGEEFIRSNIELHENGIYLKLGAFKYHVFLNFRQVETTDERPYDRLTYELNGKGVFSIEEAMDEFLVKPVINAFEDCINPGSLRWLSSAAYIVGNKEKVLDEFYGKLKVLLDITAKFQKTFPISDSELQQIQKKFKNIIEFPEELEKNRKIQVKIKKILGKRIPENAETTLDFWRVCITLHFLRAVKKQSTPQTDIFKSWFLDRVIKRNYCKLEVVEEIINSEILLFKCFNEDSYPSIYNQNFPISASFEVFFSNKFIQEYIRMHAYENNIYFNKERFEELLTWRWIDYILSGPENENESQKATRINSAGKLLNILKDNAESSGYELDNSDKSWEIFTNKIPVTILS